MLKTHKIRLSRPRDLQALTARTNPVWANLTASVAVIPLVVGVWLSFGGNIKGGIGWAIIAVGLVVIAYGPLPFSVRNIARRSAELQTKHNHDGYYRDVIRPAISSLKIDGEQLTSRHEIRKVSRGSVRWGTNKNTWRAYIEDNKTLIIEPNNYYGD